MADSNIYEQVYNVREDKDLPAQVALVTGVLARRGLLLAGFNSAKELLMLHYTGYSMGKPVWELDFFEHLFASEPLLAVRGKVTALFICSDKNLVIPDVLYDEASAAEWLKKIHFTEPKEVTDSVALEQENAEYVFAVPMNITELIKINFGKAAILPLALYQFRETRQGGCCVECCITNDQACATIHNNGRLLWHRVFDYTCAEDIAYELMHVCNEHQIPMAEITLLCNALCADGYDVINGLSQYFPRIKSGNGSAISGRWDASISLAGQLVTCV